MSGNKHGMSQYKHDFSMSSRVIFYHCRSGIKAKNKFKAPHGYASPMSQSHVGAWPPRVKGQNGPDGERVVVVSYGTSRARTQVHKSISASKYLSWFLSYWFVEQAWP